MCPVSGQVLRVSTAAAAIGKPPNVVRGWLKREQVALYSVDTGGWRDLNLADVALLAVVARLVDWGITVEEANRLAHAELDSRVEFLLRRGWAPSVELLRSAFAGRWLILERRPDLIAYGAAPHTLADVLGNWGGAGLIVDLGAIVLEALASAVEAISADTYQDDV